VSRHSRGAVADGLGSPWTVRAARRDADFTVARGGFGRERCGRDRHAAGAAGAVRSVEDSSQGLVDVFHLALKETSSCDGRKVERFVGSRWRELTQFAQELTALLLQ
jgi:hypothetical protein